MINMSYSEGESLSNEYLSLDDLYKILPFKKTKILLLLKANILPVVKIGRDYLTTKKLLNEWIEQNTGKEIYY
jgi:hypothetical protein